MTSSTCFRPSSGLNFIVKLLPDEQIIYNHRLETLALNTVDAGRVMQWTDGYLIFQTASFDQIVKTIERKFDVTINYETERFFFSY